MGLFEPQHLIIILVIALLIFGPGKISELGGSLGRGIRDFKKAMAEEPPHPAAAPAQSDTTAVPAVAAAQAAVSQPVASASKEPA